MALRFSSRDEDAFRTAKRDLVAEVEQRLGPEATTGLLADIEMFLDWTVTSGDGRLDSYDADDLNLYLLGWCPWEVVVPGEDLPSIVIAVRTWIEHLVVTGRWAGGPAGEVLESLDALVPEFIEEMIEHSRYHTGRSAGSRTAAVYEFADVDEVFDAPTASDLPMTEAPDPELAERQALLAPLVHQIDVLREYLGQGVKLTATGNPKLGDAKAMMEILATDDHWERPQGNDVRTPRSANQLPHMMFLLRVATAAGALQNDRKTLAPSPAWEDLGPFDRCTSLLSAALDVGVVSRGVEFRHGGGRANVFDDVNDILDDGGLHLLIPAFIAGEEHAELMVAHAIDVVRVQLEDEWPQFFNDELIDRIVERDVNHAFETFERLGMVELRDRVEQHSRYGGDSDRTGGSVRITDLGRLLIEQHSASLGYIVHHVVDLVAADAADAVLTLATSEVDPLTIWQNWAPDKDPVDKFDDLMDVLATASTGPERLATVALLAQAPPDVRRRIEAMADGPRAAYALTVLDPERSPFAGAVPPDGGMAHDPMVSDDPFLGGDPFDDLDQGSVLLSDGRPVGLAIQELGPARSLAPLVDLLWLEMDVDPADLLEHVILLDAGSPESGVGAGAFTELLEDLWRVDLPETVDLLEFLGANHPVRATANQARTGLVKHRSAYPGRR